MRLSEKWWVSPYNFTDDIRTSLSLPRKVCLYDCTLRDGEQTPGVVFRKDEKVAIAKALDQVGVARIEAGMPIVSAEDREAVKEIAHLGLNAEVWGFSRCVKSDIDANADCGVDNIICEIATSEHKQRAYGFDKTEVIRRAVEAVAYAKERGLYTAFFAVDMTRSDLDYLRKIYTSVVNEAHADEVVAVDTLGVALPEAINFLTKRIKEWVDVPVHIHCHNDFGLATACTLAGLRAGAEFAHVSVNGLGEKTGNADLAEVALSLRLLYDVDAGIKLDGLCELSRRVEDISRVKVHPGKPVVGINVFRRESGLAVQQLVNYPPSVESYLPELVGGKREIVIGKKSGKHAIQYKLHEMGIGANDSQIETILRIVKAESEEIKGLVSEDRLKTIATDVVSNLRS
jgi:isopropylmalate/homocitrate/citramalate synthase